MSYLKRIIQNFISLISYLSQVINKIIAKPIVSFRKRAFRWIRNGLVFFLTLCSDLYGEVFPKKPRPQKYYIEAKVDLTMEYFLNDESTITVLGILAACYSMIFVLELNYLENSPASIGLKIFTLIVTFVWLFYDVVRKIWNIWREDRFAFGLKTDPADEKEALSENIKQILNAEAEGYQEEKLGYFKHIEKVAQKVHRLYHIKKNSDMNLNFFQKFAEELKYDVQIVDPEYSDMWTPGLNGVVYSSPDPAMRKIVLNGFSDKDKKTMQFLLHELGHVLFGYIRLPKESIAETKTDRINYYRLSIRTERDANYFAAAMLCCEYKFKRLLNKTRYDLIEIMNDDEYKGLSYETIAHRTASLSEIKFHVFKMDQGGSLLKCFTNSGLDYNYFNEACINECSAKLCFERKESHHIGRGIYTKISKIPNKIGDKKRYFCFAKELTDKNNGDHKSRVVYAMGCSVEDAEKHKLKFYDDHIKMHPEDTHHD